MLGVLAAVSALAACSGPASPPGSAYASQAASRQAGQPAKPLPVAVTRVPSTADSVLTDTADGPLTAGFARTLFTEAPVVVVSGSATAALTAAEQAARAAHAPLLLASPGSPQAIAALAASAEALHPVAVLTEGLPAAEAKALAKRLPGVKVVGRAAALPATRVPAPLSRVAVLVPAHPGKQEASVTAVTATAEAAGAAVV